MLTNVQLLFEPGPSTSLSLDTQGSSWSCSLCLIFAVVRFELDGHLASELHIRGLLCCSALCGYEEKGCVPSIS